MKIRNALLTLIFTIFLLGPGLLIAADKMHVELPADFTAQGATYLSGGITEVNVREVTNIQGFASGEFQNRLGTHLENYTPCKYYALLGNAANQRGFIQLSNLLFNWDCYPTYYSSLRIQLNLPAVAYIPEKQDEAKQEKWEQFASGLFKVAARNPDKRFVLYIVQGYQEPGYSPAYDLVSSPLRPSTCIEIMSNALSDCPNVTVLTRNFDNEDNYYSNFFKTDHHWNIRGALGAYSQITDTLDLQTADTGDMHEIPDYLYSGATARWALDLVQEHVFDCDKTFEELTAISPNGNEVSCGNHEAFYDVSPLRKPYAFYDTYYDNLANGAVITGGVGSKSALLIGNSFKAAIQRPLAWSYNKLTSFNQLHANATLTDTLEEQMDAANADDIIIVANPHGLTIDNEYWR